MAGENLNVYVGNLAADPELRFTPSGVAVANLTVCVVERILDRQSGEWKDGDKLFLRGAVWRQMAENAAESLTKGMRVWVQGKLRQRSYEKDGDTRYTTELDILDIGPSLKFATATVNKATRSQGNAGATVDDPWGSAPVAAGVGVASEPPF